MYILYLVSVFVAFILFVIYPWRYFKIDRDNHTCKICGNSTNQEPNLLLEVDHIVPIAKGGITSEDNLQCLCWKCNRTKGSK